VNLAAINPSSNGFATLYPCSPKPPNAASLNFAAGQNISNATNVKLSESGEVCVFSSAVAHFAVDVVGHLPAGSDIGVVDPARIFDTRSTGATVDGSGRPSRAVSAGSSVRIQVGGRASVPTNAQAVTVNLAAIRPAGPGFATLYPCNTAAPNAASLNFVTAQNVSNATTVALSPDGELCLFSSTSSHYAVDVVGFVPRGSELGTVNPSRFLDTRSSGQTVDGQSEGSGSISAGRFVRVSVAGRGSVPADAAGAIVNLAAVRPADRGYATLYPCTSTPPNAASLNFDRAQNISNATTVKLSGDGDVCIFSSAASDFALDVVGYIATPGTALESLETPSRDSCAVENTADVRGNTYTDVMVCETSFGDGHAEFNLGTRYQKFNGFLGVTDTAPSGTETRVTISLDGVQLYQGDFTQGDPVVPLDLDVTGGLRLRIDLRFLSSSGSRTPIVFTGRFDSGRTSADIIGPPAGPAGSTALESLETPSRDSCAVENTADVRGNTYTDVMVCETSFGDGHAEFNLGTRYQKFNGFLGVTDTAPSGTETRVTISLDGVQLYQGDFTQGDPVVPLDLDVTGGLRLRIDLRFLSSSGSRTPIVFTGRFDSGS
jgi:hypothetical protein